MLGPTVDAEMKGPVPEAILNSRAANALLSVDGAAAGLPRTLAQLDTQVANRAFSRRGDAEAGLGKTESPAHVKAYAGRAVTKTKPAT